MKILFLRGVIPACSLLLAVNLSIQAQSGQTQSSQTKAQDQSTPADTTVTKPSSGYYPFPTSPPPEPMLAPMSPEAEKFDLAPHSSKLSEILSFDAPELSGRKAHKEFQATAYSLRGRTATGIETRVGVVAADPKVLPLGSVVEIQAGNYSGVYTVHDTGGAVKGNLVDVWMPSHKEARQFGRRTRKLQVLRYGPAKSQPKSK